MKDYLFKIKVLYWIYIEDFKTWKEEVWDKDLDERVCCPGGPNDYCACGGATIRDVYESMRPANTTRE